MKKHFTTKKIVLGGLFIALGLVMPFLTMQVPEIGSMLLPMHIPAIISGFVCGWPVAMAVGAITPMLRYLIFHMPGLLTALAMAFELAAYGAFSAVFYKFFPKRIPFIYVSLLLAMAAGRAVWGVVSYFIYTFSGSMFTWEIFAAGAVLNAIPGIILQIVLVPILVVALKKAKLVG